MKRVSLLLCTLVAAIGLATNVRGVPLQSLFDGGSIIVDDKLFFDWELILLEFSDAAPDFSRIDVIPLPNPPLNPGLRFEANGELSVIDRNFIEILFGFSVFVLDPAKKIKDNSLEIVSYDFGGDGGVIAIFEDVFDLPGNRLASKFVTADNLRNFFDLFDSAQFAPQQAISVEKNVFISGDFTGDFVSLNVFEQRFSQIPEPTTLALVAIAAFGLLSCGWRHRDIARDAAP